MKLLAEYEAFLATVESYNGRFNAVRAGDALISLVHPFWSGREIEDGLSLRGDWDVPEHMAPFYGDWHTLLCLDLTDGAVLLLDDSRLVIRRWGAVDEFVGSLTTEPEGPAALNGVIEGESWLDI